MPGSRIDTRLTPARATPPRPSYPQPPLPSSLSSSALRNSNLVSSLNSARHDSTAPTMAGPHGPGAPGPGQPRNASMYGSPSMPMGMPNGGSPMGPGAGRRMTSNPVRPTSADPQEALLIPRTPQCSSGRLLRRPPRHFRGLLAPCVCLHRRRRPLNLPSPLSRDTVSPFRPFHRTRGTC